MASMDLIAKPFTLMSLAVLAGVRSVSLVTATWRNFVRGIVDFHVGLCWRGLVWIGVFVSLPVKIVTALHRERTLQDVKEENSRLNGIHGKSPWDYKSRDEKIGPVHEGIPVATKYRIPSWSTAYKGIGTNPEGILINAGRFVG